MCWSVDVLVRLRNVCYTCTDVSSYTSHGFPREHVHCEEDHGFFVSLLVSLCVITLRGMFFKAPVLKLSPEQVESFLPVVFGRSLLSALFWKLINLSAFLSRTHNKAHWIICTCDSEAGETRGVIYFLVFFLCSTLQQPLSLFSYCNYWVWCWYKDIIMRHISVYL